MLRNTVLERVRLTSIADWRERSMRGRGSGPDVVSQASKSVNSEFSGQASGSTEGYEGGVGSLGSGSYVMLANDVGQSSIYSGPPPTH